MGGRRGARVRKALDKTHPWSFRRWGELYFWLPTPGGYTTVCTLLESMRKKGKERM